MEEQNQNLEKKPNENKDKEYSNINDDTEANLIQESIIDLPKLSTQSEIKNSDVILAILEICTFNKSVCLN